MGSTWYRGVKNNHCINIPIASHNQPFAGDTAKAGTDLPDEARVVLSIAAEYKYGDGRDFVRMAQRIVDLAPNVFFVLVGPSCEKTVWCEARSVRSVVFYRSVGLNARCCLNTSLVQIYTLKVSAFGSYTAFLEVAAYGVPLLR